MSEPKARTSPIRTARIVWLNLAGLAAVILVLYTIYAFRSVLTAFFLAALLAYLLDPVVDQLERVGLSRWVGILLLMIFLLLFVAAVFVLVFTLIQSHATDLIQHAKENFDFGIAAACYPEAHPESLDADSDLYYTKMKVEQGAEFLITQLFYDNEDYYAFVDRARQSGIDVPIIPGLMPILNVSQIRRITSLCGATIPVELDRQLERHADDNRAVRQIGINHTLRQAQELMASDVPGIHFYVLNRRFSITKILDNL